MSRLKSFSPLNPTGEAPGVESIRMDVLKAAVENRPPIEQSVTPPTPSPAPPAPVALINKNIRLPADLVEFIDFVYTKDKRMKKQDAYTEALEAFFRPLMSNLLQCLRSG